MSIGLLKEVADSKGDSNTLVKNQLHDITERMSKLLCHYEGDEVLVNSSNGDTKDTRKLCDLDEWCGGDEVSREYLLGVLADFHTVANEREEMLNSILTWFDNSKKVHGSIGITKISKIPTFIENIDI